MLSGTVYQQFVKSALEYKEHPFLQLVNDTADRYGIKAGSITYQEALAQIQSLAAWYQNAGLNPGDRVAIGLDNRPDCFYHWIALNGLAVSVVPLNPQWQSAELEYVLGHSEAIKAIVLPQYVEQTKKAAGVTSGCDVIVTSEIVTSEIGTTEIEIGTSASDLSPGDINSECALLYTSGTTGRPKGCILSNQYFLASGEWYMNLGGYCALTPGEDRLVTPLPMYHMNAMATSTMAMMMSGSCIVPLDRFHPSTWWQSINECNATIIHYLGVMPAMLMNMKAGLNDQAHNIRFGFGAGLSGELHTAFEERFGISLIEAWAMTETGCTVAVIASEEPRKVGTACFGRPPAHMDYRLVDDTGNDVSEGQPGELLVRRYGEDPRYGFFAGYLKDEAATSEAWAGDYFHTGDLVYVDEDGLMHFVDRKKNVIRRSGENISAVEVEEIAMEHPSIQAIGITSVPDEIRGDEVFACVVTNADSIDELAKDVVDHCLNRLAYYKAPGYISRVDALPLTSTEKIQRTGLKALANELLADGNYIDTRDMKVRRG